MKKVLFLYITNAIQHLLRKNSTEPFETCSQYTKDRSSAPENQKNTSSGRALFTAIFTCAAALLPVTANLPASAQYADRAEASYTPTPTATPTLTPEPTETQTPDEYIMPKIFVPTNTPESGQPTVIIPWDSCKDSQNPQKCDLPDARLEDGVGSDTLSELHVNLKEAFSFTGTYGNIYQNTCDEAECHMIDFNSQKPSIDMAVVYDTSSGSTGINAENTLTTLESVALNSSSGQNVTAYLLNTSVDLFNTQSNAVITAKVFDVVQTGGEAAINVFGDASIKAAPPKEGTNTKADQIKANTVELAAKGGKINVNAGAVKTDVSNAATITAEGVKITAENNTENNTTGQATFTSGRQWYYHVNKWERKGEETLVVDSQYLDISNNPLAFEVTPEVIENSNSYNQEKFKSDYSYGEETYDIYFLKNASTGEVLYAAQNGDTFYKAIMTAGTYKQCEPAYPGDITVSAVGETVTAYGAHLTTEAAENKIRFETTNGGGIRVSADGSGGKAYGLYTESAGGAIDALIEGSITESGITGASLGDTAGIAISGEGGLVNIQVGVVPAEPPVGTKEIKVSGDQVGVYDKSGNNQEKNVVVFGTINGSTAPILLKTANDSSFTLAAWAIQPENDHVAFTKENETLTPDTAFEERIRYILLADPSLPDTVIIESDGTGEARAITESGNTETIQRYCESGFSDGFGHNLRDEQDNFYIQNRKENTKTYYWANAGDTVTVKSNEEGYHITEAYWREGKDDAAKMDCSAGICSFTVPMGGGVWIHDIKLEENTAVTVRAKDQTVRVGGEIDKRIDQAELIGAQAGHVLSAVKLTASNTSAATDNGTITPTEAEIKDGSGNDVTNLYNISYQDGKLTVKDPLTVRVAFEVKNGAWDDGTKTEKTVTLTGYPEDGSLKLKETDIPAAGTRPDAGYKIEGSWDPVPVPGTTLTQNTTFVYTYEELITDNYTAFAGENQDHEKGSDQDVIFIIERVENDEETYSRFRNRIQLRRESSGETKEVAPENYDVLEGSLIIKLHADFVNTLPPDNYTLRVFFEDGICEIRFAISEESPYKLQIQFTNSRNNGAKGTPEGFRYLPLVVKISIAKNGQILTESKLWPLNLDGSMDNEKITMNVSFDREIPDPAGGAYTITISVQPETITLGSKVYRLSAEAGLTFGGGMNVSLFWDDGSREERNTMAFYPLLYERFELPATGFSSTHPGLLTELRNVPDYKAVRMSLQIPALDVETELVRIPLTENSWEVQHLGERAGVMEGFSLPGQGCSLIAAHNTLSDAEYGPFALLSTLETNDLITVNGENGLMQTFRVYANELLVPDDFEKLAAIAGQEENSLVLITCENESAEGGYLHRRAVFARPL